MPLILLRQTILTPSFHLLYKTLRIAWLFISLLFTQNLIAQNRCATQVPSTGEFEVWIQQKIHRNLSNNKAKHSKPPIYTIPIVVHVLHRGEVLGEGVNLSYERIKGQIDSLNADFRRMNADTINTPEVFEPVAADVEIQFVLAKQDPEGNPSSGIVRKKGERNSYLPGPHKSNLRSESYWPPEDYLNIYLVDLVGFLGFSSFPNTNLDGITFEDEDNLLDAILIDYQYFGINPNAPSFESYGRTLTHEAGHYLGLRHIWGDSPTGCSSDDFVDDTPLADNHNAGLTTPCTFPNPDDNMVCETDEMFQNYMDYTDDICMNLFTSGQKERMRIVMENSPRRVSLSSSAALTEPTRFPNDLAITKIISPDFAECSENIIPEFEIINFGTNDVTTFDAELMINGMIIQTMNFSTSLSPLNKEIVSFPIQNINSIPSEISIHLISVNDTEDDQPSNDLFTKTISWTSPIGLPYVESFESTNTILGRTGASASWEVTTAPRNSANNQALKFKAFNDEASNNDEAIIKTPIFDLSGFNSAELNFSYAHATLPNGFWDGLVVKVSTDCGNSFHSNPLFSRFGANLSNNASEPTAFTPSDQTDWQDISINVTSYVGVNGVQFAFFGLNGGGNNIYLDDIEVLQTNLNANDISPIDIQAPLVTCKDETFITLRVRNVGFQNITSFQTEYFVNAENADSTFSGLSIPSGQFQTFRIKAKNLTQGKNQFSVKTTLVNGVEDESNEEDTLNITIIRNLDEDEYPLKVNFESNDNWLMSSIGSQFWERTTVNRNHVLKAKAFDSISVSSQSWFVSPILSTGELDSTGLYFRASYASRTGFNDQLEVRVSVNCGESYGPPILVANSDSLAVTQSSAAWLPRSDSDWKEYKLDLSPFLPFKDDIRIAFVFTNGGGNNLFIDDISIRSNEEPAFDTSFKVFPNPATSEFNIGFNLSQKEKVTIQLMDMTGKIIFEDVIDNALNQILPYTNSSMNGLYFIRVTGQNFVTSQKIFFNSN